MEVECGFGASLNFFSNSTVANIYYWLLLA